MKRLTIGLDIDGVIAEAVNAMLPVITEVCNRPLSPEDINRRDLGEALNIDEKSVRYIWEKTLETDLLRHASPIDGAVAGLSELGRHEIWIVTARPAFLRDLTVAWFQENNIRYDHIVFDRMGDKISAGPEFDVFVEDFIEKARIFAHAGIFTLLFDQPWNQVDVLPENCQRVHDWSTVVKLINRLEGSP